MNFDNLVDSDCFFSSFLFAFRNKNLTKTVKFIKKKSFQYFFVPANLNSQNSKKKKIKRKTSFPAQTADVSSNE